MCFTGDRYLSGYYVKWLSLAVSVALAQPTFDRSACLVTSPLCRTSWYAGSSNQNTVWRTEFPRCSSSRLELASVTAALCLHWSWTVQRWA